MSFRFLLLLAAALLASLLVGCHRQQPPQQPSYYSSNDQPAYPPPRQPSWKPPPTTYVSPPIEQPQSDPNLADEPTAPEPDDPSTGSSSPYSPSVSGTAGPSSTRGLVRSFLKCVTLSGAEKLCNDAATALFAITWPAGLAVSGGVCNALVQAYNTGTIDAWQVVLAGGSNYVSSKLRLGKLWDAAMTALSFGECLMDEGIFH